MRIASFNKFNESWDSFLFGLKHEIQENRYMREIITQYIKSGKINKGESEFIREQSLDIIKMLGLVGVVALPGSGIILPTLIASSKKFGVSILPRGFKLLESMSETQIIEVIQDGKEIFVDYIKGYSEHDKQKSYRPVDIMDNIITLDIDGEYYITKLKWVSGINENIQYYEVEPYMTEPPKEEKNVVIDWKQDQEFKDLLKDNGGYRKLINKIKKKYGVDYSDCSGISDLHHKLRVDGFL